MYCYRLPEGFEPDGPLWAVWDDGAVRLDHVPSQEEQDGDCQVVGSIFMGYVVAGSAEEAYEIAEADCLADPDFSWVPGA